MEYIRRKVEIPLKHHLERGKSLLLLGPRQTGKTTLLKKLPSDLTLSFVLPRIRQRYEKDPSLLAGEVEALNKKKPLVILDEVQKIPIILDVVQELIDRKLAQFMLTGSSARKLRRGTSINLLPGRLVTLRLDPFVFEEHGQEDLTALLAWGSLPSISLESNPEDRETDLQSYVEAYLEEEVRAEAIVRNIGSFSRFLEFAGLESGKIVSFRALSQELGVSHTTIAAYFEVLEDCLVVERVDPLTHSTTRKKLTKSSRYLIFDMGVRRLCAGEGSHLTRDRRGELFEQLVGLELIRVARLSGPGVKIRFWRDPDGPEVDWIIDQGGHYLPVEVKWTDTPSLKDVRHLEVFLKEYQAAQGYVVCQVPRRVQLAANITAVPWQEVGKLV